MTNKLTRFDPTRNLPKWRRRFARVFLIALIAGTAYAAPKLYVPHFDVDPATPVAGWIDYGGDRGGQRYSPATQITPKNVKHLRVAWEYNHGDFSDGDGAIPSESAFEATPILIDDTLYVPTPFNRIIALDPETGEERWTYDPEIDLTGRYANQLISRGVTMWMDADSGQKRLFAATNDARLIALEPETGEPCNDFGASGQVDLNAGTGEQRWKGEYQVTSAPAVVGGVVIVGSAISDNARTDAPSGVLRAYDVHSGALRWAWDLRPPDFEPKPEMLTEAGYLLGTPNVWAPMSVDDERGLVFVPTGNPAPDYYGGVRDGIDYYGSSVVALKADTGEVVWHFQTVHHDLWDFDVPCQPTLTHVVRDGEEIPVVIQATKMGLVFVLHRETGEPIFEVEEREVPQSDVPGEQTSPTQPFPVKPAPLVGTHLDSEDAWGLYWGDKRGCRELIESLHFEGMYTPPKLDTPTLMYPGNAGGTNWGGVAVDPERQILVANVMDLPWVVTLFPIERWDEERARTPNVEMARQEGTPYALRREMLISALELPCSAPPWGTLNAIDLNTGDLLWKQEFGTVRDLAPMPLPIKLGVPNLGGPCVTASGVIFIGAAMDDYLRAFDIETGKELWKGRLPAGGQATPMTYRISETGKQYVVICAGGHSRGGTKLGDSIIAYALP
jgi:quinoprotein glucose dehydrogenase